MIHLVCSPVLPSMFCHFGTYPDFETVTTFQLMSRFRNISWFEIITRIHINVNLRTYVTKQDFFIDMGRDP